MSHEEPDNLSSPPQPEQTPQSPDSPLAPPAGETSAATLSKAYDPSIIERRWAEYWVRERLFEMPTPTTEETPKNAFTMLLPPPNVTGNLHMGHMFEHTESDILMRWHRMSGETSVWVPGTDHAGIATQMLVERQLASEGATRKALGREAFTARVWEWKRQYGSAITNQMKRLGASVDWSREYFTMDDRLNVAVREAFVRLYEQGLIYRGSYIVNWDPVQQTAVSDLEVTHEERVGKLYHIRYPFADRTGSIVVATTRPETMLGDVAVAVNANDARYREFIGKRLSLPLSGVSGGPPREIPILADDWANPEFGTGAVKVTPAHDPNDFAIGQRHSLPSLTILDETAHISLPGSPYHGLDRFAAREKIVADLDAAGLLVEVRDHPHAIALSQRTGTVIEPRLSLQWFVAVNKPVSNTRPSIAQTAIDAVRDGHIKFTPEMYEKTYMEWMTNIHDWCISRQLWWGHRIPAWHCAACNAITVARETPNACATCGDARITQETDVLDTWFSSGLLPFTVFGWPGGDSLTTHNSQLTTDLAAFYPTSLLVTGFDILFFWVARMIMLGCHFMLDVPASPAQEAKFTEKERREVETRGGRPLRFAVPFKAVYIHALVRDANREKMSKTKGNVVDPIEIIERFGTDAVRFTLASMASPGTDIAFSEARTEGYRAFANKIWNAARFLFMNLDRAREANIIVDLTRLDKALLVDESTPIEAAWIVGQLNTTTKLVNASLLDYRFDEAARYVYRFFWNDFCDWYLEFAKRRLNIASDKPEVTKSLSTLLATFEATLRLLSPFMPFITEEIWHALYEGAPPSKSIALADYPKEHGTEEPDADHIQAAFGDMLWLQTLITEVRAIRKELGIPERESVSIAIRADDASISLCGKNGDMLHHFARIKSVEAASMSLTGANARSNPVFDVAVLYERQIDIPAERERLIKDLAKYEKGLAAAERQLGNDAFMAKAPAHIVEGLRKQAAETRTLYDKTKAALVALG